MFDSVVKYQTLASACAERDWLDLLQGIIVEEQMRCGDELRWTSVCVCARARVCVCTVSVSVCVRARVRACIQGLHTKEARNSSDTTCPLPMCMLSLSLSLSLYLSFSLSLSLCVCVCMYSKGLSASVSQV